MRSRECRLAAQGLTRRIVLQFGHFVSAPFLVAQSDLVATLPRPLAIQCAPICDLLVAEPPFAIPPIEVKQIWHKRFDGHPRLRWRRRIVAETSQNRPSLGTEPQNASETAEAPTLAMASVGFGCAIRYPTQHRLRGHDKGWSAPFV